MDIGQNWVPQSLDASILTDWPVNPGSSLSRYEASLGEPPNSERTRVVKNAFLMLSHWSKIDYFSLCPM